MALLFRCLKIILMDSNAAEIDNSSFPFSSHTCYVRLILNLIKHNKKSELSSVYYIHSFNEYVEVIQTAIIS